MHTRTYAFCLIVFISILTVSTGSALAEQTSVTAAADTYLKNGTPNKNQGTESFLRIRSNGKNRTLVRVEQDDIVAALGGAELTSAILELTISDNGNNWGTIGRTVDIHRLTQAWTEFGATWNCAHDPDTTNQRPDCIPADDWEMGKKNQPQLHPWVQAPTDTTLITKFQTGTVSYDVTSDVQSYLAGQTPNLGWIIRKTEEGQAGRIEFATRETGSGPRLVLDFVSKPCATITFADPNLEAAVRLSIGLPSGPITDDDVANLTSINAPFAGIVDLSGTECLTALTSLAFEFNQISDITPLGALPNLVDLFLDGNQIQNINAVSSLSNLERLVANQNQISSLAPLAGLSALRVVCVRNNMITDVTPLSGLNLTGDVLCLENNQITDISPLSTMTGLTFLRFDGNQISDITPISAFINATTAGSVKI